MSPVTGLVRLPGRLPLWRISAQLTGVKFKKQNQNGGTEISIMATIVAL